MRHARPMIRLAIYDLDKTITRRPTYTAWLLFWARREAPWRLLLLPLAALWAVLFALRLIGRGRLKELCQALLMGRADTARVAAVATAFAARTLARNVRPGALTQLAADRASGHRIVIATASYEFYVAAIAAALGVDDVVATRAVVANGRIRPRIDGENCYAFGKLRMVEAWAAAHGVADAPFAFYTDHYSDMPLLRRAADAVAANASLNLRVEARTRGWRVVDWR